MSPLGKVLNTFLPIFLIGFAYYNIINEALLAYTNLLRGKNVSKTLSSFRVFVGSGTFPSWLITWYFKHCIGTTSGVGTNRWLKYTIEQIPILEQNKQIEQLAAQINSQYETMLDTLLDKVVCEQYGLNDAETDFIINL